MAKPRLLTGDQRSKLLEMLAADYSYTVIRKFFESNGWPHVSWALVHYYRKSRDQGIMKLREERRTQALLTGLAIKAERVARLQEHADKLEVIKWEPDKNGRLWNEKAWRETLDEIATEMGQRKTVLEIHDWRKEAQEYGLNPDELMANLFAKVPQVTDAPVDSAPALNADADSDKDSAA